MKDIITRHKTIISNTLFLSIIQVVRILSPFVALPYVISVIGGELYGEIAFAQSVAAFAMILINFGLDFSAVRDVSQNRDNNAKIATIISSVLSVKLILFFLTTVIYSTLIFSVPTFRANPSLYFIVYCAVIPELIFPTWYFQGIERMRTISLISTLSIIFYISTVFIFVRTSDDYLYVPILQVCGSIFSSIIGFVILLRVAKVRFHIPCRSDIVRTFKDSVPFFTSRVSVVANTNIAKLVSGFFLGMTEVAIFDLAQRVMNFAHLPFHMLIQAIFPHNSKHQSVSFARKSFFFVVLLAIVCCLAIWFLSPWLLSYLASDNLEIVPLAVITIRYLLFYYFFAILSFYLGTPLLVAWGYNKPFNRSVVYATVVLLWCYGVMYLVGHMSLVFFAISMGISDLFVSMYRLYYCRRYKIL